MKTQSETLPVEVDLRPQLWRILVEPLQAETKTAGGIVLPGEVQEAQQYNTGVGEVIAVGAEAYDGITKSGIDLSKVEKAVPGDFVVYGAYSGQSVETKDGRKFRFLTADMILAKTSTPEQLKRYV